MILGIMGDTHGNAALMRQVAEAMQTRFGAEILFHLGDDYGDAEELILAGYDVRRVPGLWCPEYQDGQIPKRLIESFDGVTVACAHADKDLRYPERAAAIVLTGHTHRAEIALLGRSLYVNPGHLHAPVSRSERASYAIVDIGPDAVHATIRDALTHGVRSEATVQRARLG